MSSTREHQFLNKVFANLNIHGNDATKDKEAGPDKLPYFGPYGKVLFAEICLALVSYCGDKKILDENTEFLQALYNLHVSSNNDEFTVQTLFINLKLIIKTLGFKAGNNESKTLSSGINISSLALRNIWDAMEKFKQFILENPLLRSASIKKLILEKNEKWEMIYPSLEKPFGDACEEISNLMRGDPLRRKRSHLLEVELYLTHSIKLIADCQAKLKAIEDIIPVDSRANPSKEVKAVLNTIKKCQEAINSLDLFMRNPSASKEALPFEEFKAKFLQKVWSSETIIDGIYQKLLSAKKHPEVVTALNKLLMRLGKHNRESFSTMCRMRLSQMSYSILQTGKAYPIKEMQKSLESIKKCRESIEGLESLLWNVSESKEVPQFGEFKEKFAQKAWDSKLILDKECYDLQLSKNSKKMAGSVKNKHHAKDIFNELIDSLEKYYNEVFVFLKKSQAKPSPDSRSKGMFMRTQSEISSNNNAVDNSIESNRSAIEAFSIYDLKRRATEIVPPRVSTNNAIDNNNNNTLDNQTVDLAKPVMKLPFPKKHRRASSSVIFKLTAPLIAVENEELKKDDKNLKNLAP